MILLDAVKANTTIVDFIIKLTQGNFVGLGGYFVQALKLLVLFHQNSDAASSFPFPSQQDKINAHNVFSGVKFQDVAKRA